jgi:hypothetical protein
MTLIAYANMVLNAVRAGSTQYTDQDILEALQITGDL